MSQSSTLPSKGRAARWRRLVQLSPRPTHRDAAKGLRALSPTAAAHGDTVSLLRVRALLTADFPPSLPNTRCFPVAGSPVLAGWATLDEQIMPLCPGEIIVSPRAGAVGLAGWLRQLPALTRVIL